MRRLRFMCRLGAMPASPTAACRLSTPSIGSRAPDGLPEELLQGELSRKRLSPVPFLHVPDARVLPGHVPSRVRHVLPNLSGHLRYLWPVAARGSRLPGGPPVTRSPVPVSGTFLVLLVAPVPLKTPPFAQLRDPVVVLHLAAEHPVLEHEDGAVQQQERAL
jgi:hypothetical protein